MNIKKDDFYTAAKPLFNKFSNVEKEVIVNIFVKGADFMADFLLKVKRNDATETKKRGKKTNT